MCKYNLAACVRINLPTAETLKRTAFVVRLAQIRSKAYWRIVNLLQARVGVSSRLTYACIVRNNKYYIIGAERLDGQTEKARSENAGVETNWHP